MVFFGHASGYSLAVLAGLLERNLRPCAVVQHGRPPPRSPIPVFPAADTPAGLASQHGIDVLWVNDPNPASLALALSELEAGLFLVACYPRRLPGEVFRLAQRACLNLHPSLLPGYRGPAPVFWQLQDGERNTGISLHHVTDRLDAGPLVAQRRVPLPPG
ncbi:MAG: hypothetical protein LJE84_05775, partial [Gammaproteobacteria bacterium]|nr:hypothetical protein [Gammaproteobacteria bacterium]